MPVVQQQTVIVLSDVLLWFSRGLERKVRGRKLKCVDVMENNRMCCGWRDGNYIFAVEQAALTPGYNIAEISAQFGEEMSIKVQTINGRREIFE